MGCACSSIAQHYDVVHGPWLCPTGSRVRVAARPKFFGRRPVSRQRQVVVVRWRLLDLLHPAKSRPAPVNACPVCESQFDDGGHGKLPVGGHGFSPRFCPEAPVIGRALLSTRDLRTANVKKPEEAMEILEAYDLTGS